MNRLIKFRVWVPELKKFFLPRLLVAGTPLLDTDFVMMQNGHLATYYRGEFLHRPDCVAQLFTGLHDKNGKEIYEGDILRDGYGNVSEIFGNKWSCGCCFPVYGFALGVKIDLGLLSPQEWEIDEKDKLEIIGNIYENPELLNP